MKWGEWKPQFKCLNCLHPITAHTVHFARECPHCHVGNYPGIDLFHIMNRVRDERKPIWVFWRKARYEREQVYG